MPAKQALAGLLLKEGEDGLASYHNSASTNSPAFSDLKVAFTRADQVRELLPANDGASKLRDGVHAELVLVADKARTELQAYKQALAGRTAGYAHLATCPTLD